MLYKDLDATMQKSFLASIRKTFTTFLEDEQFGFVEEGVSFITDDFVQRVVEDLQEKRSFQKWAQVDLEVPDEELIALLLQVERSMRRRNPTAKQRNYYIRLVYELGLKEEIPTDYLYLKRRLLEMQGIKDKLKEDERRLQPATEKQIKTLTKLWRQIFREELEVREDMTQSEVQELFHKANSHAGYVPWS